MLLLFLIKLFFIQQELNTYIRNIFLKNNYLIYTFLVIRLFMSFLALTIFMAFITICCSIIYIIMKSVILFQ